MPSLTIGQVAASAGVAVDTGRYYERRGLVPPAARRRSGYRAFEASAVDRIKLVKELQEIGLGLDEIVEVLGAVGRDDGRCADGVKSLDSALQRVDQQLEFLAALRVRLTGARRRCRSGQCTLPERVRGTSLGSPVSAPRRAGRSDSPRR